jgi:hypothetical protein
LDSPGPFGFFVRDALIDSLLLQGKVSYQTSATIAGITGEELITIKTVNSRTDDSPARVCN